jgi:hypothetical protein
MAHLCPLCNEECECRGDDGRVVSLHMPEDCEHCEAEDDDDLDADDQDDGDELDW